MFWIITKTPNDYKSSSQFYLAKVGLGWEWNLRMAYAYKFLSEAEAQQTVLSLYRKDQTVQVQQLTTPLYTQD